MKTTIKLLLLLLFTTSFLFGCDGSDVESEKNLHWNLSSEPKSIDPTHNSTLDGGMVIQHTFEGLVREYEGLVYPAIAESWDVSVDGLKITFHLRETTWSDGTPLTAQDFIYSWKRGMDPKTGSVYAWIWEYTNIKGAYEASNGTGTLDEVGIHAYDDHTLIVELLRPTDYLVGLLSLYHFMPLKEAAATTTQTDAWASDPSIAVSNGPFVLKEYLFGDSLILEKNKHYWDSKNVNLNMITLHFITEGSTAYQAYLNDEISAMSNIPAAEVSKHMLTDDAYHLFPLLGTYYYHMNLTDEFLSDNRVRKAINLAIDKGVIVEVLGSGQIPADSFVSPGFPDSNGNDFNESARMNDETIGSVNIEEAKKLLSEAGYPNGEDFPEFEILYNTSESHQKIAEMIQEMLTTNLGITPTLRNQEWAVFVDTKKSGQYDIGRASWLADYIDPINMLAIFTTGHPINSSKYSNPEYDRLIKLAQKTTGTSHFDALHQAEAILLKDLPLIPVYHYTDSWLINEQVQGWQRSMLGFMDFSRADILTD